MILIDISLLQGKAKGFLYLDDGESFAYQNNTFAAYNFEFDTNKISMR